MLVSVSYLLVLHHALFTNFFGMIQYLSILALLILKSKRVFNSSQWNILCQDFQSILHHQIKEMNYIINTVCIKVYQQFLLMCYIISDLVETVLMRMKKMQNSELMFFGMNWRDLDGKKKFGLLAPCPRTTS